MTGRDRGVDAVLRDQALSEAVLETFADFFSAIRLNRTTPGATRAWSSMLSLL